VSPGGPDAQRPQGIPHRADSGAEEQAGCVPDCSRGVAQPRTGSKHYFVPGLVGDGVGTPATTAIGEKRYQRHRERRLGWRNWCWALVGDGQAIARAIGARGPGGHRSLRGLSGLAPPQFSGDNHRSPLGVVWQPPTPCKSNLQLLVRTQEGVDTCDAPCYTACRPRRGTLRANRHPSAMQQARHRMAV
jgi:hypothetical protein